MNSRSNPIMVYTDGSNTYCRIGIANRIVPCHDICNEVRNHICCVYGTDSHVNTERFHFDNTKHTIVLSTTTCNLCNECVDGISRCRYNIQKYIDAFVDKIDKVEAR